MTSEEITNDIIAACEAAKARGFGITDHYWGHVTDETRCACALSAAAMIHCGVSPRGSAFAFGDILEAMSKRYDWNTNDIGSFVAGFDNAELKYPDNDVVFAVGKAVRKAVLSR